MSEVESTPPRVSGVKLFFGWQLIFLGLLIALPTGLFSIMFVSIPNTFSNLESFLFDLVLGGIFGGLPCLVGIGIFLLGKGMAFPKDETTYD